MKSKAQKKLTKDDVKAVLRKLQSTYPNAVTELDYKSPFELLISTILAAQCTDIRVNQITKELYKKYNKPEDFLSLQEDQLGEFIKSCGLYRNKAKNIISTCKILVREYGGLVPQERIELLKLPGVGRKTANVVISNAFGQAAIAVDTHVYRVSNRIGLAQSNNVTDTEEQLMKSIPKAQWSQAHHWLIYHGRRICKAKRPLCHDCELTNECLYFKNLD
ncbi:MAG: endonuclease III [Alkaliphilus sp.]|nr:endonuclease III [Alkaliphilus sp.]